MSEVTLEKIDIIRERTGASYTEAKEALEVSAGNVVDALIYLEKKQKTNMEDIYTTKDEFIKWLKDVIEKGNVNRIRIKKDEKVIADIPVNAGVAATLAALVYPTLLGVGILAAVFTKVTVEICKDDGTVEVVNKVIKGTMEDVKEKAQDVASQFKGMFKKEKQEEDNTYQYTVKFEEVDDDLEGKKENKEENEDKKEN